MPTPLHNDDWGFESNCFVCEPRNEGGLRIPFQLDDDNTTVSATFTLTDTFSGAPTLAHGGVSLALLDEAQAWATIAVGKRWAMTGECKARFVVPVMIGESYRVEAVLTEQTETTLATTGRILDAEGTVCVEGSATFVVVGEAVAKFAIGGADIPEEHRDRIRTD